MLVKSRSNHYSQIPFRDIISKLFSMAEKTTILTNLQQTFSEKTELLMPTCRHHRHQPQLKNLIVI